MTSWRERQSEQERVGWGCKPGMIEILLCCKTSNHSVIWKSIRNIDRHGLWSHFKCAVFSLPRKVCIAYLTVQLIPESVPCSLLTISSALQTLMSVWVCAHTEKERERGRERSAVSHSWELLQKISPHLLLSPPPHLASIIPVLSKQLQWQRVKHSWQVKGRLEHGATVCRFFRSSPLGRWPLVRSPAARTFAYRSCTVPVGVEEKGGWSTRSRPVRRSPP